MNIETFRAYCLAIKGSCDSFPFLDRTILVFKVMDKMFCYISLEPKDGIFRACLKCDAERSVVLRDTFAGITPSEHHSLLWNKIALESDVPDSLLKELIGHAAAEVIRNLRRRKGNNMHK